MLLQSLMVAALTAGFAADDNATLVVGSWTTTFTDNGVALNITMEFSKDGKAKAIIEAGKKDITIEGTYKVDKNKLILTRTVNGKEDVDTNTIKELTKEKLVLIDDKEMKELTFTRKK